MTYDFDAMRQTLDGTAHITGGTKADRDVARIHALATVALAESVAQLVASAASKSKIEEIALMQKFGVLPDVASDQVIGDDAKPERAPDPVERDWRMGDVVILPPGRAGEYHVESVGIDQGGTFLTVIGHEGEEVKVWAEHATFIGHDSAEVLDADFAEAANAERKSDAFAAAKAKTKKAKS